MKSVVFETLDIQNFMKYKELHMEFSPTNNVLQGYVGTGKTTVLHAICWCLTNKNYYGETQFDIHKILEDGTVDVQDVKVELKLKIVSDKGEHEVVITRTRKGSVTKVLVNNISFAQKDFANWFLSNFGFSIEDMRMMTNPLFASSLEPKKLESLVMSSVSTINEKEIAKEFKEFSIIQDDLETQNSVSLLKSFVETSNNIKNKDIPSLKGRIEQQSKFVETIANDKVNLAQLKIKSDRLKAQIAQYDETVKENTKRQEDLNKLMASKQELANKFDVIEQKMDVLKEKKDLVEKKLLNFNANEAKNEKINQITLDIDKLELVINNEAEKLEEAKNSFNEIKAEIEAEKTREISFDTTCPTCGQTLPEDKIQEISDKEYAKQKENITKLAEKAMTIKEKFLNLKAEFTSHKERLDALKEELEAEVNAPETAEFLNDENYLKLLSAKEEINANLTKLIDMFSQKTELLNEYDIAYEKAPKPVELESIVAIQEELTQVSSQIRDYDRLDEQMEVLEKLKQELIQLERAYATYLAKIEAINKLRVVVNTRVTESLAVYFKVVEFITSEVTKDGIEKPTFKLAYQGRDYATISTGEKMLVSLDLLNGIQLIKDVAMPILVDSITELSEVPNLYTQFISCQTMQKIPESHPQYAQYNAVYSEVYHKKGL